MIKPIMTITDLVRLDDEHLKAEIFRVAAETHGLLPDMVRFEQGRDGRTRVFARRVKAVFESEQEFFDSLNVRLQMDLRFAGINTVHDLALAIHDHKFELISEFSDEAIQALQGINYVYLPEPKEDDHAIRSKA